MSKKIIKNITASIQAQLKNASKDQGVNFDYLLARYGIERFLFRLGLSDHKYNFILKGASLFTVWLGPSFRTTKDADFLCNGNSEPDYLVQIFTDICKIELEDALIFDLKSIKTREIRRELQYGGTCIMITARLGQIRIPLQFDIAFGDSIFPCAETVEYPTILNMEKPKIQIYPIYTVIAEKFEAMITLDLANSRLKDFYDIWILSEQFTLDYSTLITALKKTFQRRETKFPNGLPAPLTDAFARDTNKQIQWKAFIKKTHPKVAPDSLEILISRIRTFMLPIINNEIRDGAQWTAADLWHIRK